MTEQARAAQREYKRAWNAANKDRVRAYNVAYWERKAQELAAAADRENSLHNNHIERGVGDG